MIPLPYDEVGRRREAAGGRPADRHIDCDYPGEQTRPGRPGARIARVPRTPKPCGIFAAGLVRTGVDWRGLESWHAREKIQEYRQFGCGRCLARPLDSVQRKLRRRERLRRGRDDPSAEVMTAADRSRGLGFAVMKWEDEVMERDREPCPCCGHLTLARLGARRGPGW